jgi:oxygen-dependent protoporphyrinogen oxidase
LVEGSLKSSAMARNRYVVIDGEMKLMPNSLRDLISLIVRGDPMWRRVIKEVIMRFFRGPKGVPADTTIAALLNYHLGPSTAELASAVMHGIYAGDVKNLSVRSLLPSLYFHASHGNGIIPSLLLRGDFHSLADEEIYESPRSQEFLKLHEETKDMSVIYFRGGLETLTKALREHLSKLPNVSIHTNKEAVSLDYNAKGKVVEVSFKSDAGDDLPTVVQEQISFDKVISTLPAHQTALLSPHLEVAGLIKPVSVMVINLYYSNPDILKGIQGFGCLFAQSQIPGYNRENVLGVIFDSFVTPDVDDQSAKEISPGSKLTVMMGGHFWMGRETLPSEDEALGNAIAALRKLFGITEFPINSKITLKKDCISQYEVGHFHTLMALKAKLVINFDSRLAVVGSSYTGVGVNDCIRSARSLAMHLKNNSNSIGFPYPEAWIPTKKPAFRGRVVNKEEEGPETL